MLRTGTGRQTHLTSKDAPHFKSTILFYLLIKLILYKLKYLMDAAHVADALLVIGVAVQVLGFGHLEGGTTAKP